MGIFRQALAFLLVVLYACSAFCSQKFLIVANGPFDYKLAKECSEGRIVIALDGAAAHLDQLGLPVDYILGDFDSLEELSKKGITAFNAKVALNHFKSVILENESILSFEPYMAKIDFGKRESVTFIRAKSQDYTDLEKGILFCLSRKAYPNEPIDVQIICALGGERSDHTITNLFFLKKYNKKKYPELNLSILNADETIQFLKDETISIPSVVGGKFGLFGFPAAHASCKELAWPLDNMRLEMGISESVCNKVISSPLNINIQGEALLIITRVKKQS